MFKFIFTIEEYLKIKALFNAASTDLSRLALSYVYYRGATTKEFIACNGHLLRIEKFDLEDRNHEADCFPSENILLDKVSFNLSKKQLTETYGKFGPVVITGGFKEWVNPPKEEKVRNKIESEAENEVESEIENEVEEVREVTEEEKEKIKKEMEIYGPDKISYPNIDAVIWDDSLSGCLECFGLNVENLRDLLNTFFPEPKLLAFRFSINNLKAIKVFVSESDLSRMKYCGVIMPIRINNTISDKEWNTEEIKKPVVEPAKEVEKEE